MIMNNKHKAVWAAAALIVVFLGLVLWYMATHPAPMAVAPGTSTTTPPVAVGEPVHIIDSGEYYDIDAAYPGATPLSASAGLTADEGAVMLMRAFAENSVTAFKENVDVESLTPVERELFGLTDGRKYAMTIEYDLYQSPNTITYVYLIFQDTLGAHPNTYYRTFTFDRATGENLHMEDLFIPGAAYLERLSARTRVDLPQIMASKGDISPEQVDRDFINTGTLPITDAFGNFAIDGETLTVIFPPYQVGPYVYGRIDVPIPLTDLRDILALKYRP